MNKPETPVVVFFLCLLLSANLASAFCNIYSCFTAESSYFNLSAGVSNLAVALLLYWVVRQVKKDSQK